MNDEMRQRLFNALLGDIAILPMGDIAREILEQAALGQLNDVEPLIDSFIAEAGRQVNA